MSDENPKSLTTCSTCKAEHDSDDPAQVRQHAAPISDCNCGRCRDEPACYMCTGSFCFCITH